MLNAFFNVSRCFAQAELKVGLKFKVRLEEAQAAHDRRVAELQQQLQEASSAAAAAEAVKAEAYATDGTLSGSSPKDEEFRALEASLSNVLDELEEAQAAAARRPSRRTLAEVCAERDALRADNQRLLARLAEMEGDDDDDDADPDGAVEGEAAKKEEQQGGGGGGVEYATGGGEAEANRESGEEGGKEKNNKEEAAAEATAAGAAAEPLSPSTREYLGSASNLGQPQRNKTPTTNFVEDKNRRSSKVKSSGKKKNKKKKNKSNAAAAAASACAAASAAAVAAVAFEKENDENDDLLAAMGAEDDSTGDLSMSMTDE